MKIKYLLFVGTALCSLFTAVNPAFAQGTAFTFQGRLNDGTNPASGTFDLRFALFDAVSDGAQVGSAITNSALAISGGIYTVTLDYGAGVFTGADRWLEMSVRTNGGGAFTVLIPRNAITPTPYAILAGNVSGTVQSSNLTGTYGNAMTFNNPANSFNGSFSGGGTGLTNVNAATLGGLTASNFWKLGGNAGANPTNNNFLGTTDNLPLELKVNGVRALRLEPTLTNGAVNVISGSPSNYVGSGKVGATIGGGGAAEYLGFPFRNRVTGDYGTVSGGGLNASSALIATVGGGAYNTSGAEGATVGGGATNFCESSYSTISGGGNSAIGDDAHHSNIGGGSLNWIDFEASYSTIGGGAANYMYPFSSYSTIDGGMGNQLSNEGGTIGGGVSNSCGGWHATVPGGTLNSAIGDYSFAAGRRAQANHQGTFVWGDSSNADIASTNNNSWTVRASGGVRFFSNTNATAGVILASNATSWSAISDRNAKKNFQPLNKRDVLERLVQMPVERWNYKWENDTDVPHIGPVAQDFKAAFYPNRDDTSISTLEFDGVELAAIQGLNQKVEEKDARIKALEQRLDRLEQLMNQKNGGAK